jgi:hypothetical protein
MARYSKKKKQQRSQHQTASQQRVFINDFVLPSRLVVNYRTIFPLKEWEALALCHNRARKLAGNAVVDRMERNPQETYGFLVSGPTGRFEPTATVSEVELNDLVTRLRPFMLQGEPTHVPLVCKHLKRRIEIQAVRDWLDIVCDVFEGRALQIHLVVPAGAEILNSNEFLMKWLTSKVFHVEPELEREVDAALAQVDPELARYFLVLMLKLKLAALTYVCELIAALDGGAAYTVPNAAIAKFTMERRPDPVT